MTVACQAFFLTGAQGALFALYYFPKQGKCNKFILHVPAFAEENNCSRHIVDQQCRAFVEQGYSVLVIDLYGTGDSQGDFADATWAHWQQDIVVASQWLHNQGAESITLWGLRTGALLAIQCVNRVQFKVDRLILWQPVLIGEVFVMQFLRLKVIAAMLDHTASKVSTQALKEKIFAGHPVEVAGYQLNPELIQPLLKINALQQESFSVNKVLLIEVSDNDNSDLPAIYKQYMHQLQNNHQDVTIRRVIGDDFWSVHGFTVFPDLISSTLKVN